MDIIMPNTYPKLLDHLFYPDNKDHPAKNDFVPFLQLDESTVVQYFGFPLSKFDLSTLGKMLAHMETGRTSTNLVQIRLDFNSFMEEFPKYTSPMKVFNSIREMALVSFYVEKNKSLECHHMYRTLEWHSDTESFFIEMDWATLEILETYSKLESLEEKKRSSTGNLELCPGL